MTLKPAQRTLNPEPEPRTLHPEPLPPLPPDGPLLDADQAGSSGVSADNPLLAMPAEERSLFLQAQILSEVRALVGHAVHPEEPLMATGREGVGGPC